MAANSDGDIKNDRQRGGEVKTEIYRLSDRKWKSKTSKTVWASWRWSASVRVCTLVDAQACVWVCVCVCVCARVCIWQCDCWVLAHHTLLWPNQITRKKKTHTEAPGGLTSAVPKHTTVCIHMEVACVPFHQCEQHASIHTKHHADIRSLHMSSDTCMHWGNMQFGLIDNGLRVSIWMCWLPIGNPEKWPPLHPLLHTRDVLAHILDQESSSTYFHAVYKNPWALLEGK